MCCCSSSCRGAVVPRNASCDVGRYVKHRIWTSDSHEHSSTRCRMSEAECVSHGMTIKAENLLLIKLFYWPIHSWHCQWAVVDSMYKLNSERCVRGCVSRNVDGFPWQIRTIPFWQEINVWRSVRHGIKSRQDVNNKVIIFKMSINVLTKISIFISIYSPP